jgi:hypothetical protein
LAASVRETRASRLPAPPRAARTEECAADEHGVDGVRGAEEGERLRLREREEGAVRAADEGCGRGEGVE